MYKTAGITLLTKVSSAVLTFAVMVMLSRLLGPEQRGICSYYLVVITAILIISDFAGGSATAFLLKDYAPVAILHTHLLWSVLPALVVPCIFFFTGGLDWLEVTGLVLAGWLHSAWTILQHIWLGLRQYKKFNLFVFLAPLLILLSFGFAWQLGFAHRYAYLAALIVSWGICFAGGFFFFYRQQFLPRKALLFSDLWMVFKAGGLNQFSHLVALAHTRLIYFLLPPTFLGVYSNALTITEASFMLAGSLGQVMYTSITADRNNISNKLIFSNFWWIVLFGILIAVSIVLLIPNSWYIWLFGPGFEGVKSYLFYLAAGMLFNSLFLIISYWQSAFGNFLLNLKNLLLGFAFNLALTAYFLATEQYSIEHGALALVCGWAMASLAAFVSLVRQHGGAFLHPKGVLELGVYVKQFFFSNKL